LEDPFRVDHCRLRVVKLLRGFTREHPKTPGGKFGFAMRMTGLQPNADCNPPANRSASLKF
jgi:hypothetical protein